MLRIPRPDIRIAPPRTRLYRNPVIFAKELQAEMTKDHLTRQQLASRHGISLDRVIQWLALLKLPRAKLAQIEASEDLLGHRLVTKGS